MVNEIDVNAEADLQLPSLDQFINAEYPRDDDLPDELRPRKTRRSKKREAEAVESLSQTLAMVNGMFALVVPCACAPQLPPELRGVAHLDTCTKAWPLSEDEVNALTAAIQAELESHPEWASKLSNMDSWIAHGMLISAVFAIVMNRRMRSGALLLPDGIDEGAARDALISYRHSLNGANPSV